MLCNIYLKKLINMIVDEFEFYENSSDKAYKVVADARLKAFKTLGF